MPQPKILKIVLDMRADGLSDKEIIENLRQLGLTDEQIKKIMELADQDVYSKFKREMSKFVEDKIAKSTDLINKMVDQAIEKRLDTIKKEITSDTERMIGQFAKAVNEKSNDMALAVKKIREENLKLTEETKLMRADIDLLLAGPSKMRLMLSLIFLGLGIIVLAYSIFFVTPQVISLDFAKLTDGVILMVTGAMYIIASIVFVTVGVYFSGRPGRQ
ncbi:MAG: hypothetical protein J7K68_01190 [Candidatus Diapherotrites archaeon]|nr:hypothetical protein [Candidatus Diapherotrites archaeon]